MSRTGTLRSGGYVVLCSGILSLFLLASVMGFTDPPSKASGAPDWIFWPIVSVLLGLLGRAPFVGLVIRDERVTRRSWLRTRSWPRSEVSQVSTASYSGILNRYSESGRFSMIVLTVDGVAKQVPELAGGPRKTEDRLRNVAAELDISVPSTPGRHRPTTSPN